MCDEYEDEPAEEVGIGNNVSEEREVYIRTFIHFVQPNTYLNSKKLKGYSKAPDKFQAWTNIGLALTPPMSGDDAQKLFGKLREKFEKERKKVISSQPRSGAGASCTPYVSQWIFFQDLSFLTEHIIARQTSSNIRAPQRNHTPPPTRPHSAPAVTTVHTFVSPTVSNAWSTMNLLSPESNHSETSSYSDFEFDMSAEESTMDVSSEAPPDASASCSSSDTGTSMQGASAEVLRSMAAAIQPVKAVPPHDIAKKRKRSAEKIQDTLSTSTETMSTLAGTLAGALKSFSQPRPPPPPPPPPTTGTSNLQPEVQAMLTSIGVFLNRVPEENQLECLSKMLCTVQSYLPKRE